jgi:hypothetical protein
MARISSRWSAGRKTSNGRSSRRRWIGLLIISISCLAAYALFLALAGAAPMRLTQIGPRHQWRQTTQTAGARFPSPTTPPTRTPVPNTSTPTSVVLVASPTTPPTIDPAQATANALATQQALTPSPTATALPTTGFADEAGFPTLVVLGAALVVVVIIARRMRMRPVA